MANPDNIVSSQNSPENSSEKVDYNQDIQEKQANEKFEEIFNKIYGNQPSNEIQANDLAIQKDGDKWSLMAFNNPNIWLQKITISWFWENGNEPSHYTLERNNWKFKLETNVWERGVKENVIDNITPEELLNNFLPKIEKRLNEWVELKKQQRLKAIEDANQYAYQQDQQNADRLLQENWLA